MHGLRILALRRDIYPPAHASRACPTCALFDAKPGQARVSWRGGATPGGEATRGGAGVSGGGGPPGGAKRRGGGWGDYPCSGARGCPPPLTPPRHSLRSRGEG